MFEDVLWTTNDKLNNEIYLSQERWEHITNPMNHPEMTDYENELRETVRFGARKQEALNPQKFRYTKAFDNLTSKIRTLWRS